MQINDFIKLYKIISYLHKHCEYYIFNIEKSVSTKTGCKPIQFLSAYINNDHDKSPDKNINSVLYEIKYYLKLKIIYDTCVSFLGRSEEFIEVNDINIFESMLLDLFKPFIEIFVDNYYEDSNNTIKIINNLFTKNTIFCYLSKFLFRYDQSLFYNNYQTKKNNDILSIHQFLMGSGKSTLIIPYLVYNNYINDIKTMVLIPDNLKIKNEMIVNIGKVLLLFNDKVIVFNDK